MSGCPLPDVLAQIALDEDEVDSRDREHAAGCHDCARRVELLRRCIASGIDDLSLELRQIDALLAELSAERQAHWYRVVRDPRFHRTGFVRRLLTLAYTARGTGLAVAYSNAATIIVERMIGDRPDIADLRFDAWRYHTALLREIGQYYLCGNAFASATAAAAATSDPELSNAIIFLSRALLAIEPDIWQPEEGRELLLKAERVFERRDPARLQQVRTAHGMLAHREGRYEEAAAIFGEALATISANDDAARADALGNYVAAAVRGGRADDDLYSDLDILTSMDERRASAVNLLRDHWLRGLLLLTRGEPDEAAPLLKEARRGFGAAGQTDAAIRVGIDAVRALMIANRHEAAIELARDLASDAIGLERREPTRRHTLTALALAYLRDGAARELLTPDLVVAVAQYVDRVMNQRPVEFLPPMPLQTM